MITKAQIEALLAAFPEESRKSPKGSKSPRASDTQMDVEFELIKAPAALKELGPKYYDNYGPWFKVGFALRWISDDAFDLWNEWSKQSSLYDADTMREKWNTFPPPGTGDVTAASLHRWAMDENPDYRQPRKDGKPEVRFYFWSDGEKPKPLPYSTAVVADQVLVAFDQLGFELYKRGKDLLVVANGEAHSIVSGNGLRAFLEHHIVVEWSRGVCISFGELLEALKLRAEAVHTVTTAPHFPPLSGVVYLHKPIEPSSDTSEIAKVLELFRPATQLDGLLILALLFTLLWGGQPGTRPPHVIRAVGDSPIGSGKTALATVLSTLAGLVPYNLQGLTREAFDLAKKHMATGGDNPRMLLADNESGILGGDDAESFATARYLTGHGMYLGQVPLRNDYTIVITTNSDAITKDLASRVVEIQIAPAEYDPNWQAKIDAIDLHKLYCQVAGFFQRPTQELTDYTRFPAWCREILGRMTLDGRPVGNELVALIKCRSEAMADDSDAAQEIRERIVQLLRMHRHDPDSDVVVVRSTELIETLNGLTDKRMTAKGVTTLLKQHVGSAALHELSVNKDNTVRGFIWRGVNTDPTTLKSRLVVVDESEVALSF